jgi:hypothetical protein
VRNWKERERTPMVTELQQKTIHTIKVEYEADAVTSFGGLALAERMGQRLRLWSSLSGHLPKRRGDYSWLDVVKSVVLGLLSGAQGTFAAQSLREDAALLGLAQLDGAPEEATVWRSLEDLGKFQASGKLSRVLALAARRTLEKMRLSDLLLEGFVPIFPDGSLLEGSERREGTKTIREKGTGLMWSAVFVGRVLAALRREGGYGDAFLGRSERLGSAPPAVSEIRAQRGFLRGGVAGLGFGDSRGRDRRPGRRSRERDAPGRPAAFASPSFAHAFLASSTRSCLLSRSNYPPRPRAESAPAGAGRAHPALFDRYWPNLSRC